MDAAEEEEEEKKKRRKMRGRWRTPPEDVMAPEWCLCLLKENNTKKKHFYFLKFILNLGYY